MADRRSQWGRFVDALQVAVGAIQVEETRSNRINRASSVIPFVPSDLGPLEIAALGGVFVQIFVRAQDGPLAPRSQKAVLEFLAVKPDRNDFVSALTIFLCDGNARANVANQAHPQVRRAVAMITEHFGQPLSLEEVATRLDVSRSHLARLLRKCTGRTFLQHLHHRRITEACELLQETALSIKEVTFKVGYASTNDLDRHFKKTVGLTPSEWRIESQRTYCP